MALVDYASSDEEGALESSSEPPSSALKRKRDQSTSDLPPLPSKFHDLYASTVRTSTRDDPSLHGGRKRTAPHVEGNWPTHVYIEWHPSETEHDSLAKLIYSLREDIALRSVAPTINSFLTSDLGTPLPLHISLSRPIGFLTEQKDEFGSSLEQSIKSSGIRPFDVAFSSLDWVANFEGTRWFLVLRLQRPEGDGLNKLLHTSNTIVQQYGQLPLYTNRRILDNGNNAAAPSKRKYGKARPSLSDKWTGLQDFSNAFHISIAWALEQPNKDLLDVTRNVKSTLQEVRNIGVHVEEVKSKIGNVVTSIPLPRSAFQGKGLFES